MFSKRRSDTALEALVFCHPLSAYPAWPLQRRFWTPEEISRAACVRRQWRCAVEYDEEYWEQQCSERFALATPKAFTHERAETWR